MTVVKSTETAEVPLSTLGLNLARHYLGNRWALLVLGGLAVILGLYFGGWAWLVAAGLAPIILATLPCLVMCGLGFCMMCRSGEKQSTVSRDATDAATSSSALGVVNTDSPSAGAASGCSGQVGEVKSPRATPLQTVEERSDSHA